MKVSNWFVSVTLLCFGLMLGAAGQVSADSTCTYNNYSSGAQGFPGTYVGTVSSSGCQIGDISSYYDAASISSYSNPSIYEFYYSGSGPVTIQEELGYNVYQNDIDVELDSLNSLNDHTPTLLSSIQIPGTFDPSGEYNVVSNDNLAAGYYAIDTYFATNHNTDPSYQINITPGTVATPEPASILLSALGIAGLFFMRRRPAAHHFSM